MNLNHITCAYMQILTKFRYEVNIICMSKVRQDYFYFDSAWVTVFSSENKNYVMWNFKGLFGVLRPYKLDKIVHKRIPLKVEDPVFDQLFSTPLDIGKEFIDNQWVKCLKFAVYLRWNQNYQMFLKGFESSELKQYGIGLYHGTLGLRHDIQKWLTSWSHLQFCWLIGS